METSYKNGTQANLYLYYAKFININYEKIIDYSDKALLKPVKYFWQKH